jgi:hypothetical protein
MPSMILPERKERISGSQNKISVFEIKVTRKIASPPVFRNRRAQIDIPVTTFLLTHTTIDFVNTIPDATQAGGNSGAAVEA